MTGGAGRETWGVGMRSELAVGFAAMSNRNDINASCRVVDQIEDTVVADTNTIGFLTMQLLNAERPGLLFEGQQLRLDAFKERSVEGVELFFSGALEDDVVAQWERRLTRSAR